MADLSRFNSEPHGGYDLNAIARQVGVEVTR